MSRVKTYTAMLAGNRREIHTTTPKALLIKIEDKDGEFRNHCWIEITQEIENIQPRGHSKPIKVSFSATAKKYLKQGNIESKTLHNVKNIKRIK